MTFCSPAVLVLDGHRITSGDGASASSGAGFSRLKRTTFCLLGLAQSAILYTDGPSTSTALNGPCHGLSNFLELTPPTAGLWRNTNSHMSSLSLLYQNTPSFVAVGAPCIAGLGHELAASYSSVPQHTVRDLQLHLE